MDGIPRPLPPSSSFTHVSCGQPPPLSVSDRLDAAAAEGPALNAKEPPTFPQTTSRRKIPHLPFPMIPFLSSLVKRLHLKHNDPPRNSKNDLTATVPPKSPEDQVESSKDKKVIEYLTQHPIPILKVLVIGAPNSGKRSLCQRYQDNVVSMQHDPLENGQYRRTIHMPLSMSRKNPVQPRSDQELRVRLEWTTLLSAALDMHQEVLRQLVRDHEAYVLVYRVSEREGYEAIVELYREFIAERKSTTTCLFVVANGMDVPVEKRTVSGEEGRRFAESLGAEFREVSARTGIGYGGEDDIVLMARSIILGTISVRK